MEIRKWVDGEISRLKSKKESQFQRRAEMQRQAELQRTPMGRSQLAWERGQIVFTDSYPIQTADFALNQILAVVMPPEPRFPNGSRWVIKHVTQRQSAMNTKQLNVRQQHYFGASVGRQTPVSIENVYTFEREAV